MEHAKCNLMYHHESNVQPSPPQYSETMETRRAAQRSRIPKPVPIGGRRRCGSCIPSPRVSQSTVSSSSRYRPTLSINIIPVESTPRPVLLETVRKASHDGTTEDPSVQWRIPAIEEEQQDIQDLDSVRVVSPDRDNMLPSIDDALRDDSASPK